MNAFDSVLTSARLLDGEIRNVGIRDGRIAAIEPASVAIDGKEGRDLGGALLLPGFVDGHVHLDTTLFGDIWRPHIPCTSGFDVGERLQIQKQMMAVAAPLEQRASALVEQAISRGSTTLRTHVEIDVDFGLSHLAATVSVREKYADAIDIQIVALARGLLRTKGTADLLDEAMRNGADLVGGLDPLGFEGDIHRHLDIVFGTAEKYGTGVDLHLHDGGEDGLGEIDEICRRTVAMGLQGRVNISHAYALGEVGWDRVGRTADRLAQAGVSIMTNAPGNHDFPPVLPLRRAGVTVFAGNDDIRDSWWPYGDADMLERAMLIGYRSGFLTDDQLNVAFDMVTFSAARALSIEPYGVKLGHPADLVAVNAAHAAEAVVARPPRIAVFKRGKLVADGTGYRND